jgi:hypothetical protein
MKAAFIVMRRKVIAAETIKPERDGGSTRGGG